MKEYSINSQKNVCIPKEIIIVHGIPVSRQRIYLLLIIASRPSLADREKYLS